MTRLVAASLLLLTFGCGFHLRTYELDANVDSFYLASRLPPSRARCAMPWAKRV